MDKNKMLIDATHPEETRVVVLRNGRVEEFDFESASRKLLRGNIYLAKVTRVEPSLQAAFIEYGGNRHGFLAFNEIHPDYYQIPIADRELLKQEEAEAEAAAEAEADERSRQREKRRRRGGGEGRDGARDGGRDGRDDRGGEPRASYDDTAERSHGLDAGNDAGHGDGVHGEGGNDRSSDHHIHGGEAPRAEALSHVPHGGDVIRQDLDAPRRETDTPGAHAPAESAGHHDVHGHGAHPHDRFDTARSPDNGDLRDAPEATGDHGGHDHDERGGIDHGNVEEVGGSDRSGSDNGAGDQGDDQADDQVDEVATVEDALEELPERPRRRARQYKIQEVIKRRQIILIQVVKEERGNKGAALTTYISLAGRYTVLMPNTGRGGGISRKITQAPDRKRLKAIAEDLDVAEGMGLIIRTAGAAQSKQEIKRDYEYLLRLWESVRDMTLTSTAPCLVYEEGNLIKRSIRDLYSKDIDDIQVAGEGAYNEASDFMGMLMPGHEDAVVRYDAPEPLFTRFGIERQLSAMFNPVVTLRSGGYIVINQTEALVAVDVNSGKSTREFSIEETALNTNIEAAEEVARQLKLRDLAGLIVVDFIDMEEKRNNRTVERRMKDALRHDRARIQVGRISHFGLLEMSRQRLRTGVVEGSTSQCPHCQGTGNIRSTESIALVVMRAIEDHLMKQPASLAVSTSATVALYILNNKRAFITEIERRLGIAIVVEASDRMHGASFAIERTAAAAGHEHVKPAPRTAVSMDWGFGSGEAPVGDADEPEPDRDQDRASHGDNVRDVGEEPESRPEHRPEHRSERGERGGHRRDHRRDERPEGRDRSEARDLSEGRDRGEARNGRDAVRDEQGPEDAVRAEGGEEGGRSRRRRRRRGRRDREGGDDRGHVGRERSNQQNGPADQHVDRHVEQPQAAEHGSHDHVAVEPSEHGHDRPEAGHVEHDRHIDDAGRTHEQHAASGEGPDTVREADAGNGEDGQSRRGRRRGRRGGRSRQREEGGQRPEHQFAVEGGVAAEATEWGLHEVARPGAGQPGTLGGGAPPAREPENHEQPARHDGVLTTATHDHGSSQTHELPLRVEHVPAPAPAPRVEAAVVEPRRVVETAPVEQAPAAVPRAATTEATLVGSAASASATQIRSPSAAAAPPTLEPADNDPNRPVRKGWWQRRFG